jgi:hypothetical protein
MTHGMHSCRVTCSVIALLTPNAAGGFYPFPLREEPVLPQVRRKDSATSPQSGFASPSFIPPTNPQEAAA